MALYRKLLEYVHKRMRAVAATRCRNLFTDSELEEVVADVMVCMMTKALANFRGHCMPELIAYVRTVSDRTLYRVAEGRARERRHVVHMEYEVTGAPGPESRIELVADSPLNAEDQRYLVGLIDAGSKAEHARRLGVSRAAVTQRIVRIKNRIETLPPMKRSAHEVWMAQRARDSLEGRAAVG